MLSKNTQKTEVDLASKNTFLEPYHALLGQKYVFGNNS